MCTHCKRPTRTFLQAKSHEFVSAKKERERSVLDRVSDSMTNMATKLIMSDMDERFLAMKEYIDLFEAKMMALQEANTGMQEERKELIRFELCWEGGGECSVCTVFERRRPSTLARIAAPCENTPWPSTP